MLYLALHVLLWSNAFSPLQSPILPRGAAVKVDPLMFDAPGGIWGPPDRTADHATVAINSRGDVAIASHTSRTDIAGHPALKQVEVAIFTYDRVLDQWTLAQQELLGSIHYDPIPLTPNQDKVKCERPDVIAVGERFFVVWTRRYDGSLPNQFEEPAVLECSWLQWDASLQKYVVLNDSATVTFPDGLGFELDRSYHIRECAGVPDAVLLDPGDALHDPTVGVVYPHQTDFGDDPQSVPPFDGTRRFDLRFATCSLTATGTLIGGAASAPIVTGLVFDGPTDAMGSSAGLVVPDSAPMPIPEVPPGMPRAYRFWLAYEDQSFASPSVFGRIRLSVCEGSVGGTWTVLDTRTFGGTSVPTIRRRPNVASYPAHAGPLISASIAFNKLVTADREVVYEEWSWDETLGLSKVLWPPGSVVPNDPAVHEFRPVPWHGRSAPLGRRCAYERVATPCRIDVYDVATNTTSVKASSYDGLGRPAVAYRHDVGADRDDFVLTWEQYEPGSTTIQRIWLRVE